MCLGVWQRISQPPILWLNAEHPLGDGFGSLQNGKSIFAEGVIGGLGEKKFCAERGGCACVTSRGAKFCIFFHSLFVCNVQWEKHEWADIYKRCCTRQDLRRGCFSDECMWVRRCGSTPVSVEKTQRNVHTFLSLTYANMPLLTFFIISYSFLRLHSTSSVPHEKPELQFDIPPAEGVNTAGLHPAGI